MCVCVCVLYTFPDLNLGCIKRKHKMKSFKHTIRIFVKQTKQRCGVDGRNEEWERKKLGLVDLMVVVHTNVWWNFRKTYLSSMIDTNSAITTIVMWIHLRLSWINQLIRLLLLFFNWWMTSVINWPFPFNNRHWTHSGHRGKLVIELSSYELFFQNSNKSNSNVNQEIIFNQIAYSVSIIQCADSKHHF